MQTVNKRYWPDVRQVIPLLLIVLVQPVIPTTTQAGAFTNMANVAFSASDGDAIDGKNLVSSTAVFSPNAFPRMLVDGLNESGFFNTSLTNTATWELGTTEPNRYISRVDIWCTGIDPARRKYDFDILVSSNGTDYTTVAQSGYVDPGAWTNNLARFTFEASETRGVQYVRVIEAVKPRDNQASTRITEIDVFTEGDPVSVTVTPEALNQSAVDDINGMTPSVSGGTYYSPGPTNLTDAVSSNSPADNSFAGGGTDIVYTTWDFGAAIQSRFLSSVDFWMATGDPARENGKFEVLTSADGTNYQTAAATSDILSVRTNSGTYRISVNFARGYAKDFRYLRIKDQPARLPGQAQTYHGRIMEIDAFMDRFKGTVITIP